MLMCVKNFLEFLIWQASFAMCICYTHKYMRVFTLPDNKVDSLARQPLSSSKESVTILKERKPSKLTSGKAKSVGFRKL